jgi:hypothetical protein
VAQLVFEGVEVHASQSIARNRREGKLQHRSDAFVGVVGLFLGENPLAWGELAGDPEGLEIGEGAARGQVP